MITNISKFFDKLSEEHKHLYQIMIGLLVAFIGWLIFILYSNIIPIVNGTVGLSSGLLDLIYLSIAKGDGAYQYLILAASTQVGVSLGILLSVIMVIKGIGNTEESIKKRDRYLKLYKFLVYIGIIYILIASVIGTYKYLVHIYYNQSISVIAPYISDQQLKLFNSSFAQIKSKQNYVELIRSIKTIAENNNLVLPKFQYTITLP